MEHTAMASTAMVEMLRKLRTTYDKPISDMSIIRQTLASHSARLGTVEMPPILDEGQRKIFLGNLDELSEFLESEDGADAIELLVNAFTAFVEARKLANQPQPPDEPE